MGQILDLIQKLSGGTCYQTEQFALDYFIAPEYQDEGEKFDNDNIFETDKKEKRKHKIVIDDSLPSLLRYFMDGSERVYKIADFDSTDGKFLPIVAGQIGAAICSRQDNKRLKKHVLRRENVIAVPDRMGGGFEKISVEIPKIKIPKNKAYSLSIGRVIKYITKSNYEKPFENLAKAKIQAERMQLEIQIIQEMVDSNSLETNQMLVVDGSLKFSINESKIDIFKNVIGVAKTFDFNLQGMLQSKNTQIGSYLLDLEFGERTPVYVYNGEGKNIQVGAWYLRVRDKKKMKKPLDGIIKIEKVVTKREKSKGFDTDIINEISRSILLERNVTCYGNDERWANHIYPIYLTESLLKNSFVSSTFFLNIF